MSCLKEDAKTPFELMSIVKRWGSSEFHQYTMSLKKLADKALENASEDSVLLISPSETNHAGQEARL